MNINDQLNTIYDSVLAEEQKYTKYIHTQKSKDYIKFILVQILVSRVIRSGAI